MKAWIFSDLHTEAYPCDMPLPVPDADVCLCAGNICVNGPASAVTYLGERVSRAMPVILVAGNRDYYRSSICEGAREAFARAGEFPNVHLLSRSGVMVGGIRFFGATLWGDTELLVSQRLALFFARREAEDAMKIKMSKRPLKRFSSTHLEALSGQDRNFLRRALRKSNGGTTIVLTHHAPSQKSLPPELLAEARCANRVGELEAEIQRHQPAVWVHGNLNNRSDYSIAATRVICNPRGYPARPVPGFDPGLVIDLNEYISIERGETTLRRSAAH